MKIAVCVHIFYTDMIDSIFSYLNNLKRPYDLYVSLVKGFYDDKTVKKLQELNSDVKIVYVENIGVDIGGFFQILKIIDKKTDLILKIHTKKGIGTIETPSFSVKRLGLTNAIKNANNWYNGLMRGVLGDSDKVERILTKFQNDEECGMVGFKLYNSYAINKMEIKKLLPLFNLNESVFNYNFIGGTMFWVRYSLISKYFSDDVINQIYNNTKKGYVLEPSIMHAVERIFGYVVENEQKKIMVID